jgi:PD-(D/E)XK nuclease superfamily
MTIIKQETRLSYSSATLLQSCSRRYWHYKVNKTKFDEDYVDDYAAFNVGKAFHYVLETTLHKRGGLRKLIENSCKQFNVEDDKAMIHAMVLRYLEVHNASGLEVVKCELEISNEFFLGFIDAVAVEPDGGWWIIDLKTAASVSPLTFARLKGDTQLNLYASFAAIIAEHCGLDPNLFRGARYRTTKKSKLKRKLGESYDEFVKRIQNSVESYDAIVPVELMRPAEFLARHKELHALSLKLRNKRTKTTGTCNFSQCESYFRPCPYFSNCHGSTITEAKKQIVVNSWESTRNGSPLVMGVHS